VIDNARNEVRNEEGCGAINPCCSGIARSWDSRGAAAEEGPSDRISIKYRQQWIFHQAEKELTTLPGLRYSSGHKKGRLKIPPILPAKGDS
jgi:hypothetical protein